MPKISLTQWFVENIKPASTIRAYFDTKVSMLYLQVYPSGEREFFVRFHLNGMKKNKKLGSVEEYSIKEARRKAIELIHKIHCPTMEERSSATPHVLAQEFSKRYPRKSKRSPFMRRSALYRALF